MANASAEKRNDEIEAIKKLSRLFFGSVVGSSIPYPMLQWNVKKCSWGNHTCCFWCWQNPSWRISLSTPRPSRLQKAWTWCLLPFSENNLANHWWYDDSMKGYLPPIPQGVTQLVSTCYDGVEPPHTGLAWSLLMPPVITLPTVMSIVGVHYYPQV